MVFQKDRPSRIELALSVLTNDGKLPLSNEPVGWYKAGSLFVYCTLVPMDGPLPDGPFQVVISIDNVATYRLNGRIGSEAP